MKDQQDKPITKEYFLKSMQQLRNMYDVRFRALEEQIKSVTNISSSVVLKPFRG